MKKCLKITIHGKIQSVSYCAFVQKHAQKLGVEGTIKKADDGGLLMYVCGAHDALEGLIDQLYKGTSKVRPEDVFIEPFVSEKDFRGAFRVIA